MPNYPKVSVIIPSYNCLEYLPAALGSIAAQAVESCEVIIADDGSDDGTLDWLQTKRDSVPRVRWVQTQQGGPAVARNRAIREARGEYIAFLDADDVWLPGKLKSQLAFHERYPEVVMSFTDYIQVDPQGRFLGNGYAVWEQFSRQVEGVYGFQKLPDAFALLFAENPICTSSVMVRRDLLLATSLFDEHLPSAEDIDLWLNLARSGPVGFSTDRGVSYLVRPGSESSKFDLRMQALELICARYLPDALKGDPLAARRAQARFSAARAQQARLTGARIDALREHGRAFCLSPSLQRLKALLVDCKSCVLPR